MPSRPTLLSFWLLVALGALSFASELEQPASTHFRAKDDLGFVRTLKGHAGQVVVLIAWNSRGPGSAAYVERLNKLAKRYKPSRPGEKYPVVFYGLASNHFETLAGIRKARKKSKLNFPILHDPGGLIAKNFKTFSTPMAVVIDRKCFLRYRGAIDDDPQGKKPKGKRQLFLQGAVDSVRAGNLPIPNKTKVTGFRIRFK